VVSFVQFDGYTETKETSFSLPEFQGHSRNKLRKDSLINELKVKVVLTPDFTLELFLCL
jgi:hypothetical protein